MRADMINQPFNNDTTQSERRTVQRDTYLARAQADAEMSAGGRVKRQKETMVTGTPTYPTQPASSPWHSDPVPAEEPLGYEIDFLGEQLGGASSAPASPRDAVEPITPLRGETAS